MELCCPFTSDPRTRMQTLLRGSWLGSSAERDGVGPVTSLIASDRLMKLTIYNVSHVISEIMM